MTSPAPRDLVWMATAVDADFTVVDGPAELTDALRQYAERCATAAGSGGG